MLIRRHPLCVIRAENDLLWGEDGARYIDLFSAHGTAWLGHNDREIRAALAAQLERIWITGGLETSASREAKTLVEEFFPPSHELAGLYSTGMEAAEFALRLARVATKRSGAVGFERSMHGKSVATAYLGWDNGNGAELPGFHRLPFVPGGGETEILRNLERVLSGGGVSAVFVEPLQGSGGGHAASDHFYREASRLCGEHGTLLVFDEILTGFYRTGNVFFFSDLGFVPDVVLIGKGLGNGFPVSGVVASRRYPTTREMLPGSTFSGNPLAAATVAATLRRMRALDLPGKVERIAGIVRESLAPLQEAGVPLRGKGAMWILELPSGFDVEDAVVRIFRRGVAVGYTGRQIRILPAATIEPGHLAEACAVIRAELSGAGA